MCIENKTEAVKKERRKDSIIRNAMLDANAR